MRLYCPCILVLPVSLSVSECLGFSQVALKSLGSAAGRGWSYKKLLLYFWSFTSFPLSHKIALNWCPHEHVTESLREGQCTSAWVPAPATSDRPAVALWIGLEAQQASQHLLIGKLQRTTSSWLFTVWPRHRVFCSDQTEGNLPRGARYQH